jgi:alkanesulfonate monooxygenase SsuD/methylene tetrahydromethanopterin reductase-like flavin-dependent oxidoreductase (luciferase family)
VKRQLQFGVVIAQQHLPWAELIERSKLAEDLGFDSIWLFDHFHSLSGPDDRECFEASTALAALAMVTSRVKIGALVYGNTHRIPTVLAKETVTLDHISNGRVILGIGAAWNEPEHRAYSIPFPAPGDRVSALDEALQIIHLLETQERTTFAGRYYQLENAPFAPKPVQSHIPVLIGGEKPRMVRLIAKHADWWDTSLKPDTLPAGLATLAEHCREFGRDPSEIGISIGLGDESLRNDATFATNVRAFHKAGARMMLFDMPREADGVEVVTRLAEQVIPDLRAELDGSL